MLVLFSQEHSYETFQLQSVTEVCPVLDQFLSRCLVNSFCLLSEANECSSPLICVFTVTPGAKAVEIEQISSVSLK